MEKSIQEILKTIDDAISKFQSAIPDIQNMVYDELQPLIKQIQIKDGMLLNNITNLKLIGTVKNKLQKIIVSANYKKTVDNFLESFSAVSNLQQDYFKQFNKELKPKKTLPVIKQLAIESTINDLVGQGMSTNVIDPIQKILNQNITTGGNYAKFQEQLRNHVLSNNSGEGNLERYTKQITTDAINQYNAQYHDAIAQDLQFNWGRYVGSNITTSRQFCLLLTKKQWVHKSQLPEIIKGHIDNEECKLSKTTGLPLGMIPGTDADNFKVRRGGYNCGHQFFWVPDSAVPDVIRKRFENKGKETKTNFYDEVKDKIKVNAMPNYLKELDKLGYSYENIVNLTGGIPKQLNEINHSIDIYNGVITSDIRTEDYTIIRKIYPNEKKIYNSLMEVKSPGSGTGLNLFINQIQEAKSLGFKKLEVSEARSSSYNGYYTWARFGYTMQSSENASFKKLMISNDRPEKDILELMSTKEGATFWKQKGFWFEGEFDLTDGSKNINAFSEYLSGRKYVVSL